MLKSILLFFKWILVLILGLLVAGVLFEQYSRWRVEYDVLKGKTFVNVNGHALHYVKKGSGNCTVVFESGLASDHDNWAGIQDSLEGDAVTLAYDRSGLFLSETGDTAKTNKSISDELLQLLEKTNCPKPYIVVGHSMGAIYLRSFIAQNRKEISGIVFVEAAHPLQMKKASAAMLEAMAAPPNWAIAFSVETGILRTAATLTQIFPEIPFEHPFHRHFRDYFYKSYQTILKEAKNDRINFEDAENINDFGDIPLIVIRGNPKNWSQSIKDPKVRADFHHLINDLQQDFLKLSSNNKLIVAERSGHIVQVNDADLIVREIRKLLSK